MEFARSRRQVQMNSAMFTSLLVGIIVGFGLSHVGHYISSVEVNPLQLKYQPSHVVFADNKDDDDKDSRKPEVKEKDVRLLCWVMTSPENLEKKAIHVNRTWGKRCDKLLFMMNEREVVNASNSSIVTTTTEALPPEINSLPIVVLKGAIEGRDWLWEKSKKGFSYVFKHHFNDADWFLKADDDTYVVVENLKHMLRAKDTNASVYFGGHIKVSGGYMSGGAGYVLSKRTLSKLVNEGIPNGNKCKQDHDGFEDAEMGSCLQRLGVELGDTRDGYGRHRFLPDVPETHLRPGDFDIRFAYMVHPIVQGMECCSDTAISFHYISPNQLYVLEYLIYHLKPHGMPINNETIASFPTTTTTSTPPSNLSTIAPEVTHR